MTFSDDVASLLSVAKNFKSEVSYELGVHWKRPAATQHAGVKKRVNKMRTAENNGENH